MLGGGARLEHSPVLGAGAIAGTVVLATGLGRSPTGGCSYSCCPAPCSRGGARWGDPGEPPRRLGGGGDPALAPPGLLVPAAVGAIVSIDVGTRVTLTVLLATAWSLGVALDRTRSAHITGLGALREVPRSCCCTRPSAS